MSTVLVAYASHHDATREVAAAIAGALRRCDVDVYLRPADDVRGPLTGWDLVVLGAPVHAGRWHHEAQHFLRRHTKDLRMTPVAVFTLGPLDQSEEQWRHWQAQLDEALDRSPPLTTVSTAVFGGVDPPGSRSSARDLRDWDAIRSWALDIAERLKTGSRAANSR